MIKMTSLQLVLAHILWHNLRITSDRQLSEREVFSLMLSSAFSGGNDMVHRGSLFDIIVYRV